MSTVEDIRKLLQDLVTPDLKALEARFTALEQSMELRFRQVDDRFKQVDDRFKQVDERFKHLEDKFEDRFKHLEEKIDLKFDLVYATMNANQQALLQAMNFDRRIERLEAERDGKRELDRPS